MEERRGIDEQKKEEVGIDGCLQEVSKTRPVGLQNRRLENNGDHSYSYSHHQTLELNPFRTHASLRVRRGIISQVPLL